MNEIRKYEFEGRVVEPRMEGDECLFSFADIRTLCDYRDARSAMRAFRKHRSEFAADDVVMVATPATVGRRAYSTTYFRASGLYLFGLIAQTDIGARLRPWVMQTFIRPHLSGARMVPADRLSALEQALASLLEERKADRELIKQLGAISVASIGHAGKMLSTFARSPEAKAYRDARIREDKDRKALERRNRILPLIDGANGNGAARSDRATNPGEGA